MNIAEIVENRGTISGEEFTICDPKRNKPSGAARPAKRMAKQPGTARLLRPPASRLVYTLSYENRLADPHIKIFAVRRRMMLHIYLFC
ncbi:hypothetical protein ACWPSR_000339 [Cronobacter turicensis]